MSPSRTTASPFTHIWVSTVSRAFWRLSSVLSSSMSILGRSVARTISTATATRELSYCFARRSREILETADVSWPSGSVELSTSRTRVRADDITASKSSREQLTMVSRSLRASMTPTSLLRDSISPSLMASTSESV